MNNQNQSSESKTKNITLRSVISWISGILFAIVGLSSIFSSPIVGVSFILASIVLIPPIIKRVSGKFNLSWGVKIFLVFLFLIIAGINMKSSNTLTTSTTSTSNIEITSIAFAENTIEKILKSPSTAKFSNVRAYELSDKKDVWAVNGYVDSQNSYGAMLRNIWEVQLDYRDGKGGIILSILFDGKKIQ